MNFETIMVKNYKKYARSPQIKCDLNCGAPSTLILTQHCTLQYDFCGCAHCGVHNVLCSPSLNLAKL